jgi:hypothetical protein
MSSEEVKQQFKQYLEKFTAYFENEVGPEGIEELKAEINSKFKVDDVIDCWLSLFKIQGPVEKVSDYKYEVYDVSNFMGESTGSSNDYIHTIQFTEDADVSTVFIKFYLVFYSLINGRKSSEYVISNAGSGSAKA